MVAVPTAAAMSETGPHSTSLEHPADRLCAAIARAGSPVCVGIDPVLERLPASLQAAGRDAPAASQAIASFSLEVMDAVAPHAACVKLQSACFERFGAPGVTVLKRLIDEAGSRGLQVILDAKRGDIGITAEHYAGAVFGDAPGDAPGKNTAGIPDWVTVNSYFGEDGIRPFLRPACGAFALVRTSNPGGDALQGARLADGRTVAELVAGVIASIGDSSLSVMSATSTTGAGGYSALGAVVAATRPDEAAALREIMPRQILLVPGFGAQGGDSETVRCCFAPGGRGAIVSASRSVIYAFEPGEPHWHRAVSDAAAAFAQQVAAVAGS